MTDSNSDDSEISNKSLTRKSIVLDKQPVHITSITYSSAIRPGTTATNSRSYFRERHASLPDAMETPFSFSTKATAPTLYSSAILPADPTTIDSSKYFEDQAKYLEILPAINKLKEDIEDLHDRFCLARSKFQYPISMEVEEKIAITDGYFFAIRKDNLNINADARAKVNENFKVLEKRVKYLEDLHSEAIRKKLKEMEKRFLLAKDALKDQKSNAIKLKSDQDFIESCFGMNIEIFLNSDITELDECIQKFEDAVKNYDASDDDDDDASEDDAYLISSSSSSDQYDIAGLFD